MTAARKHRHCMDFFVTKLPPHPNGMLLDSRDLSLILAYSSWDMIESILKIEPTLALEMLRIFVKNDTFPYGGFGAATSCMTKCEIFAKVLEYAPNLDHTFWDNLVLNDHLLFEVAIQNCRSCDPEKLYERIFSWDFADPARALIAAGHPLPKKRTSDVYQMICKGSVNLLILMGDLGYDLQKTFLTHNKLERDGPTISFWEKSWKCWAYFFAIDPFAKEDEETHTETVRQITGTKLDNLTKLFLSRPDLFKEPAAEILLRKSMPAQNGNVLNLLLETHPNVVKNFAQEFKLTSIRLEWDIDYKTFLQEFVKLFDREFDAEEMKILELLS